MARKWLYSGDVNVLGYGGVFMRHVGDRRYHAIRFDNMDEACGRDNEGQPKYHGSLVEVDLDQADLAGARSCDVAQDADDVELAFAVTYYGQYAPLAEEASNNGITIIANLKRESKSIEADSDLYEERMERPVNGLGATAREFQRGDMFSALHRGVADGDPSALLVNKMYHAAGGNTLGSGNVLRLLPPE